MNRSLKLSMMLALALGSTQAAALELGQIRVRSALGQPLLAEIPVSPASPAELQNLSASLASSEAFARAGISGGRPSLPLLFTVADAGGGQKVIRITSSAPVNDPYLDLLVQVNSGAGSSTREYAILLDPPGQGTAAAAVHAPVPGASMRRSVSSERSRRPAAPAPQGAPAAGNGVTVSSGQTLSGIVRENLPAGASANQMLLALKQANPDAFYRDNINALKAGAVLRMPSRGDVLSVDEAAARAEVLRQNDDWRSGAARRPVAVADAAARSGAAPAAPAASADDRLALVPSKSGGAGRAGAAGAHQDLLRTQEALNSLQQQSDELKSRLKDLEDINAKNTRLLALKDDEIADLQRKLAEARKAAGLPPVSASAPTAAASAAVAGAATAAGTAASVPAPAAAASAPRPAMHPAVPKPAVVPHPAAAAEEPWYTQLWAQAVGAVVVIGLLVLALLNRRRKTAAEADAPAAPSLSSRFADMPPPASGGGEADADLDELLDQLAEHPDDVALHLELVSLYYGRRDVEHFEAAAEVMYAHIADPAQEEWQDVVRMGEDLAPGHPLFAHAGLHEGAPAHEADGHGLDSYLPNTLASLAEPAAEVPPAPPLPESAQPAKAGDDFHFDADLGQLDYADFMPPEKPLPPVGSGPEKATEPAEPATPWSWSFDEPLDDAPAAAPAVQESHPHHEVGLGEDALGASDAAGLGDFSDDPVDTKLDLARAYLDMSDGEGARAMLEEVLQEGSQMQKDIARKLLDDLPH